MLIKYAFIHPKKQIILSLRLVIRNAILHDGRSSLAHVERLTVASRRVNDTRRPHETGVGRVREGFEEVVDGGRHYFMIYLNYIKIQLFLC